MPRVQRVTQENFLNDAGSGVASRLLANGFNCNALRSNAVLRKDEWEQFDQVVVDIARQRLNGVADLVNAGLTFNLTDALGVTMVQWERQADMDAAQRSMDGLTRGERDRLDFLQSNLPVFITHKDFGLSLRVLRASRKLGQPLDTAQVEVATRKVADSIEDALFNGPGVVVNGVTAYGYRTAPNRNTMNFETAREWTNAAKTGELILADVITMIQAAHADYRFGPYVLYVTGEDYVALMEDFKANSDKTILQRILAIESIQAVKPIDVLPADNVLLVQMSRDVVDIVMGEQPTTVEWETEGGFMINFKVMAVMVPRIKVDHDGNAEGIVHGTPS